MQNNRQNSEEKVKNDAEVVGRSVEAVVQPDRIDSELSARARNIVEMNTSGDMETVKKAVEDGTASCWRCCGKKTIVEIAKWCGASKVVWKEELNTRITDSGKG